MLDHPAFQQPHEHGDDYATWFIRKKAGDLIGHFGFTESDREDIEQDLALDLLQRWPRFNPARAAPCAFLSWAVEKGVATMIRRRMVEARAFGGERVPLNAALIEQADEAERVAGSHERLIDLRHDVALALENLPDDLRAICEHLKSCRSVAAAAREMGIPERTLRDRVRRLRRDFEAAGLRVDQ